MSQSVEQLFADICAEQNVHAISVHVNLKCSASHRWHSFVHWDDGCTHAYGKDASDAVANTIAAMAAERMTTPIIPTEITLELSA